MMAYLFHDKPFNRTLLVDILLNGCSNSVQDAVNRPAKIDTGCALSEAGQYDVGLVLPLSYSNILHGALMNNRDTVLASYFVADCKERKSAALFWLDMQVLGDDGQRWPECLTTVAAIFVDRNEPPLIGSGIWNRWSLEINAPEKTFSIWVPDNEIG